MSTTHSMSRRSFLGLLGSAGVALGSGLALSACSSSSDTAQTATTSTDGASASAAAGKVLVAYYSAQGHTQKMAEAIADELGADVFVITPATPYSEADLDFNDDDSRVSREHEDESIRDYTLEENAPDNWADYDTVLVGYPIWWMNASWAMWDFARQNDFSGKTVIPFCTSYSSGIGSSGSNLAEMAGSGDWQDGQRFDQEADESEAREWAQGLQLEG